MIEALKKILRIPECQKAWNETKNITEKEYTEKKWQEIQDYIYNQLSTYPKEALEEYAKDIFMYGFSLGMSASFNKLTYGSFEI